MYIIKKLLTWSLVFIALACITLTVIYKTSNDGRVWIQDELLKIEQTAPDSTLQEENNSLKEENQQLKSDNAELSSKNDELTSDNENLSTENSELKQQLVTMQEERNTAQSELESTKTSLETALSDKATLQSEVETLTARISEIEQELSNSNSNNEALQSELTSTKATLTEKETALAEKTSEVETLQTQVTELQNEVTRLNGLISSYEEIASGTHEILFYNSDVLVGAFAVKDGDTFSIDSVEEPTRKGYEFNGWALEGSTDVVDFTTYAFYEDTTFVAIFSEVEITSTLYKLNFPNKTATIITTDDMTSSILQSKTLAMLTLNKSMTFDLSQEKTISIKLWVVSTAEASGITYSITPRASSDIADGSFENITELSCSTFTSDFVEVPLGAESISITAGNLSVIFTFDNSSGTCTVSSNKTMGPMYIEVLGIN